MIVTSLTYLSLLFTLGVFSVFWLNPSLVDSLSESTILAPPVPVAYTPPAPKVSVITSSKAEVATFTPPVKPPTKIPDPNSVQSRPVVVQVSNGVPGVPNNQFGVPGLPISSSTGQPPPPPPVKPTPKPSPEPTPSPKVQPKQISISGGVLQGKAMVKVQPQYPAIAKSARASGSVQVQVVISEEGKVIESLVLSGHPLLREAALQAAKQWKFTPTELTGVPVKVQGVLTFNFTLQ